MKGNKGIFIALGAAVAGAVALIGVSEYLRRKQAERYALDNDEDIEFEGFNCPYEVPAEQDDVFKPNSDFGSSSSSDRSNPEF